MGSELHVSFTTYFSCQKDFSMLNFFTRSVQQAKAVTIWQLQC